MNSVSKLLLTAAALSASFAAFSKAPAQAAIVFFDYSFPIEGIAVTETGSGSFSYEDDLFDPAADFQAIPVSTFKLNIPGLMLTEADDRATDFGSATTVNFFSGVFEGLNFDAKISALDGTPYAAVALGLDKSNVFDTDFNLSRTTITYTERSASVPEPATAAAFVVSTLVSTAALRKRQQSA